MADIQAPTAIVDGKQVLPTINEQQRRLQELESLRLLEMEMNTLEPTRGFEIR